MIDQLTSHAQLGVTLSIVLPGGLQKPKVDYAGGHFLTRPHDQDIFTASGAALGAALRALIDRGSSATECSAVFCCPLDEAFAEARLCFSAELVPHSHISLSPYGTWPKQGREWIGCYRCKNTPLFFKALVGELRAQLEVTKVRGRNAHHIVESTFKSFARVFRACLDQLRHGGSHGQVGPTEDRVRARRQGKTESKTLEPMLPLPAPKASSTPSPKATAPTATAELRSASSSRSTKETAISVHVALDECPSFQSKIVTGVDVLDQIFTEFRSACGFRIDITCDGDTHIDDHHSAEDVSITLGKCLCASLGSKAGLTRMGCAEGESNGTRVRVVLDLSNRPHFESDLHLDEEYVGGNHASAPMKDGATIATPYTLASTKYHHT